MNDRPGRVARVEIDGCTIDIFGHSGTVWLESAEELPSGMNATEAKELGAALFRAAQEATR